MYAVIELLNRPKSWSYSAWSTYNTCPRKYYYSYIAKLPQPPSPAMERGKQIHKLAEDYVAGRLSALPIELGKFVRLFEDLRFLNATPEQEIVLSYDWAPVDPRSSEKWLKAIFDAVLIYEDGTADIIDYKTGRQYPNHFNQMQLYSLVLMAAEPDVRQVDVHLWYLDSGEELKDTICHAGSDELRQIWTSRAGTMLADEQLLPRPGRQCQWCPFHNGAGGPCWGE